MQCVWETPIRPRRFEAPQAYDLIHIIFHSARESVERSRVSANAIAFQEIAQWATNVPFLRPVTSGLGRQSLISSSSSPATAITWPDRLGRQRCPGK